MTNQELILSEIKRAPGTARALAARTGLEEKQVRGAIEGLRARFGYGFVKHNPDGSFSSGTVISIVPFGRGKTYSRRTDIHQVVPGAFWWRVLHNTGQYPRAIHGRKRNDEVRPQPSRTMGATMVGSQDTRVVRFRSTPQAIQGVLGPKRNGSHIYAPDTHSAYRQKIM